MAHIFERVAMEPQADGSVNIGIGIVATLADGETPDPEFNMSAQWAKCAQAAPHVHGWDSCPVASLFNAKQKDDKGKDIAGSSLKEVLEKWLADRRAEKGKPKMIELPTRKETVTKDGKSVEFDVPVKRTTL